MKNKLYFIIPIIVAVLMPFTALIGNKKTANASLVYDTSYYTLLDSVEYIDIEYNVPVDGEVITGNFKFKPSSITETQGYSDYPITVTNDNLSSYRIVVVDSLLNEELYTLLTFTPTPISLGSTSPRYQMEYTFRYINSINIRFRNVLCTDRSTLFSNLQGNVITGYTYSYFTSEDSGTYIPTFNRYEEFNLLFNAPFYDFRYDSDILNKRLYLFNSLELNIQKTGTTISEDQLRLDFYQTETMFGSTSRISYSTYLDLVNEANYELGYTIGYDNGFSDTDINTEIVTPFEVVTNGVESFLNIEIFPNFHVYTILLFALGFALFGLLIKYALGG